MQINKTTNTIPNVQKQNTVFNAQDNKKIFKDNLNSEEKINQKL